MKEGKGKQKAYHLKTLPKVTPAGIEPASSESESEILSIVLRSQIQSAAKIEQINWL